MYLSVRTLYDQIWAYACFINEAPNLTKQKVYNKDEHKNIAWAGGLDKEQRIREARDVPVLFSPPIKAKKQMFLLTRQGYSIWTSDGSLWTGYLRQTAEP